MVELVSLESETRPRPNTLIWPGPSWIFLLTCVASVLRALGGPLCEVPAAECGESDFCYNGGACVTTTTSTGGGTRTTTEYHCDCATASDNNGNLFAGQFCQLVATDICSETNQNLFCVNGGTCNDEDPSQGCDCPPGFDGSKCDIVLSGDHGTNGQANDHENIDRCAGDLICHNGGT